MCSVRLLGSDKSGHTERSDRPTVKNTDHGEDGHAEHCLNWNVYDIGVNCEFKMICMQKMNVIAKISCYFSAVSLH